MTDSREGLVYLLHFIDPATGEPARYRHAKHYTGWTSDLDARLTEPRPVAAPGSWRS